MGALLDVDGLTVTLPTAAGPGQAVRGLSFRIGAGETLGIVGESGSGKTMVALAIMGMLPEGATADGAVRFDGHDLLTLPERDLCRLRGDRVAMIFQEPMTALNPLHRVGDQIAEPLMLHRGFGREAALGQAADLLRRVGLSEPEARLRQYPHQLSGGQRQRVLIAMALSCEPDLLIADEPTTALDATVRSHILDLIADLVAERGMALVLISHDLATVDRVTQRTLVMYGGDAVERGRTADIFARPRHPYTQGLLGARPLPDLSRDASGPRPRLVTIPGTVPDLAGLPPGCRFHGRCAIGIDACAAAIPPTIDAGGHGAACIRLDA
ncbi:MAG: ABC transporter ATP-binding protein [Pseudomonadota bacterium]|nr:ABC transporter ATP-binding protein [Pseudomonadota bacterium]